MDDLEICPKCNQTFSVIELIDHAEKCIKNNNSKEKDVKINCQKCFLPNPIINIYILDECGHKFCKNCLESYVLNKIQETVSVECPIINCNKKLSVRDMKDILPKNNKEFINIHSSKKATERILSEYKHIQKSNPGKNGYSVNPINDNLYKWEVKFFGFDKSDPIAIDMQKYNIKEILLHVVFPQSYPFSPPFIRVIRPRFQYRTGHVTIGGSICMEILTKKGWSPENTIEAILISIRSQLLQGGARLDPHKRYDYTEQEAKEAFDRMVREHGW